MEERGWEQLDFLIISGDAYVDHPSFGVAIIGRLLEARGFKVGLIPQPDWRSCKDFKGLGKPRLGIFVSAGAIDSMVNHYTVAKKKRRRDAYSPGGRAGLRPDRASIVYAQRAREAHGNIPIILGGLEVSLRRLAHYDYWQDGLRRSILMDSKADLLVYGMGEQQVLEIAEALDSGLAIEHLTYIRGTVYSASTKEEVYDAVSLPAFEELQASTEAFAESFMIQTRNMDAEIGVPLLECYGGKMVVQNPPAEPLSTEELDSLYHLPYTRKYHPMYEEQGGVPALEEVQFSLVSSRGCFGGCSFCALHYHQGRRLQKRSIESVVEEARELIAHEDFKGYIHDVGGPTANFREPACRKSQTKGYCLHRQCLAPNPCPNLSVDHREYLQLLRALRTLQGVKKVFIRSGIRHDYVMYDDGEEFFRELCAHHISGQLKVAPEHVSDQVLHRMGKPRIDVFDAFRKAFKDMNRELGKEQYLIPYFISSHPGSGLKQAIELAEYIRDLGHRPEQVQDFYPTPGTLSTCMYYTGLDPRTMEGVYVARTPGEKAKQRALLQYFKPENYELVHEALLEADRQDLIGYSKRSLIKPRRK